MNAPLYDAGVASVYDNDTHHIYRDTYRAMFDLLGDAPVNRALDVGCGTGSVLREVERRSSSAELFGIDVSEAMLARASAKLGHFVPILGETTALEDNDRLRDLDLVLASFVLAYTEPARFFRSVHEALAPGGRFLLATTTMNSHQELFKVASHPLFRLITAGMDLDGESANDHLPPNPRDPQHLREMLEDSHFDVVETRTQVFRIEFHKGEELYRFGYEGGWFIELYKSLNITPKVKNRVNLSMRACQFLGVLPRPAVTTMEVVTALATPRPGPR